MSQQPLTRRCNVCGEIYDSFECWHLEKWEYPLKDDDGRIVGIVRCTPVAEAESPPEWRDDVGRHMSTEDEDDEYEGWERIIYDKIKAFNAEWENAQFYTPAHIILADYNMDKGYIVWVLNEIEANRGISWDEIEQEEVDALVAFLQEIKEIAE